MPEKPPMPSPGRSEVRLIDLGLAAKVRPGLVISVPAGLQDRALTTLVAHTTSLRDSRFEVAVSIRFLKSGGFEAQNLVTIPHAKLIRKLGDLPANELALVEAAVRSWLGL
jgi:mRNA interferase MazF